jgi:hypothetical protein
MLSVRKYDQKLSRPGFTCQQQGLLQWHPTGLSATLRHQQTGVSIQTLLIRYQRSVHERVMKLSFDLTIFYSGIERFQGADSEAPLVDNI